MTPSFHDQDTPIQQEQLWEISIKGTNKMLPKTNFNQVSFAVTGSFLENII